MNKQNQVCPGCTLLCDDVRIDASSTKPKVINACEIGQAYFETETTERQHFVSGQPADLQSAIGSAATTLANSKAPLICGLEHLSTEAQQTAWKIADKLGATIDSNMSNSGRASSFALQRIGKVTATIGEVANRADVIIFWHCDPASSHPRLLERLNHSSVTNRMIVVVDEEETQTAKLADKFVQVSADQEVSLLAVLRARLIGSPIDSANVEETTGLSIEDVDELHSLISTAKYGTIFQGQTERDSEFGVATQSLHSLTRTLNNVTRFVSLKLRHDQNSQSAENVLGWSSGYPMAISHSLQYPRFNWLEHSAESVLERGECDSVLFATGPDLLASMNGLSKVARAHLGSIPSIALSPISNFPSEISIQTGLLAISEAGEFCRMDDVSLPIRATSTEDSVDEILRKIAALV